MLSFQSIGRRMAVCFTAIAVSVACQPGDMATRHVPTAVPTGTSTVPTVATSRLPPASETPRGTATPSNDTVLDVLLQTPQPFVPQFAPANETGITPGQSEARVRAVLGEPSRVRWQEGLTVWSYDPGQALPNGATVYFSPRGLVQQVGLDTPGETLESIVATNGPPELVLIYLIAEAPTPPPGVTPMPVANPNGELLYLSKGLSFRFGCSPYLHAWCLNIKYCTGVPREAEVYYKRYFLPTTTTKWKGGFGTPDDQYCLRPWTGFVD